MRYEYTKDFTLEIFTQKKQTYICRYIHDEKIIKIKTIHSSLHYDTELEFEDLSIEQFEKLVSFLSIIREKFI